MKRNSIGIALMLIFALTTVTACSQSPEGMMLMDNGNAADAAVPNHEETLDERNEEASGVSNEVYYIENHASMMKPPASLEELYQQSEFVVTGKVIASETIFQNDTMYTLQQFAIEAAYKGDVESQSQILIVETGGTTTFGEYDRNTVKTVKEFETGASRRDANTMVIEGVNGHFPMTEGSEMLLFLVDTSGFIENTDEKLYSIIGTYAGKLYKTNEQTYRQAAPSSNAEISFEADSLSITLSEIQNCGREYTE